MQGMFNIFVIWFCVSTLVFAQPPCNIGCAKLAIIKYYESGEYDQDVAIALHKAREILKKKLEVNSVLKHPQKLAIVFDIDDTSLSSYRWYKARDFERNERAILASYQAARYPVIKPVREFYDAAQQQRVHLFFISARPEKFRQATIKNLKNAGYQHWTALFLPKKMSPGFDTIQYKSAIRQQLTQQGYHIVLNIGDQLSDFTGGYAEANVKIPNPLYCSSKHCD